MIVDRPRIAADRMTWMRSNIYTRRQTAMNAEPETSWRYVIRDASGEAGLDSRFVERLAYHYSDLHSLYLELYGTRPDCHRSLGELIHTLADAWNERDLDLKERDNRDVADRSGKNGLPWYQRGTTIGAMCYVERFAGDLRSLERQLDYLEQLGINYLHIMPPFKCPDGRNDGGYAVSSYREIREELGTMADLERLARSMHERGMRLALDFVFNHTSDEHEWARAAKRRDPRYLGHYYVFPNRRKPDQYEATLREIFPEEKRGSFVYDSELGGWVWSTFHRYQWDLNYGNPKVLEDMVTEMLYLANRGVDVLRLDALAFTWKELGTACESLPRVHTLIRLFRVAIEVVAPSVEFKSEAIVHPDDVLRYVEERECRISYNPLFMALSWEAVASRDASLLVRSLQHRYSVPVSCTWVNYVRCHDDIGWTFSDDDAREVGVDPYGHRNFLNRFYAGSFPGSFARGVPFQLNSATGDCRVCGTSASLSGIEQALDRGDTGLLEHGIRRMLLLHALIMFARGVPVLYLGDEYGQLNDYTYTENPRTAGDSRWVHRPHFRTGDSDEWPPCEVRERVRNGIARLIAFRKSEREFDAEDTHFYTVGNPGIIVIRRPAGATTLHVVCNVTDSPLAVPVSRVVESEQHIEAELIREPGVSGTTITCSRPLEVPALDFVLVRVCTEDN